MKLWREATTACDHDDIHPLLASWEKSTHPSQIRLSEYREDLVSRTSPLPDSDELWLELAVDVGDASKLQHHYDVENYLTPLFDSRCLPHSRFVLVRGSKHVGGGSWLRIGIAEETSQQPSPEEWSCFQLNAGTGPSTKAWKSRIHDAFKATEPAPLPPGPVEAQLAFRCSPNRNWVSLWKPTGDVMGPVLGYASDDNPFHPNDDRITRLTLHVERDATVGHDVEVGIWWRRV